MRNASKSLVDNLIRMARKFWDTGDADILPAKSSASHALSENVFGDECKWLPLSDLVDGCLKLRYGIPNKDIYKVLGILGLAVVTQEAVEDAEATP